MTWQTILRPGLFGKYKKNIFENYNSLYGKNNWEIAYKYDNNIISFLDVCKLFEEAYFQDSLNRKNLWQELKNTAKEVFDIDESDILSGLDYLLQNNIATHIQDIAIRNVFKRRKWEFEGNELIQVRGNSKTIGKEFSPYKVQFHEPEKILKPHLAGPWQFNSVEDFYQSGKIVLIKKKYKQLKL